MEILNQFGISPVLLTAQVVNFLILLFILKKFLFKPILKVLEERKVRIETSLKNAEEIEQKLLETNEKIDKMMVKASEDVQKMLDEGKKSAAEILDEARINASDIALDIAKKNEENMKQEQEKMMVEVKTHVTDLVLAVFRKVTGKVLSKDDQKKIIEKEVKNLS